MILLLIKGQYFPYEVKEVIFLIFDIKLRNKRCVIKVK